MLMKKVVVGISGGVDSSVAALILQQSGYEVIGVTFMFIDDFDSNDAISVCEHLGIEHHIVDYRKEFKRDVIDKFISDYKSGVTPNPCVMCNRDVKLNFLYKEMLKLGCDYMATGHYAKIVDDKLYKSVDLNKDQTYFLCEVRREMLSHILFPLEGISKIDVRRIALENGLVNANKKDSTDVCFITENFKNYINDNIKCITGDIINIDTKEKIGLHKGLAFYTIGQRRGLDIGGSDRRMFVVGKDIENNILYVSLGDDSDYLVSDSCIVENVNYLGDYKVNKCSAKFRYRQDDIPVELEWLNDNQLLVKYSQGVKRVTPGQVCVLYDGNQCLGGGIIKEVRKNDKKLCYL